MLDSLKLFKTFWIPSFLKVKSYIFRCHFLSVFIISLNTNKLSNSLLKGFTNHIGFLSVFKYSPKNLNP